ncbi:class I SAM-dependent methyltransferase [Kitasatospora sp. CM 4170]|uniref:Class I SAM-dependent methyltransferase n=1 Tax=Kitasatospora aburaviensis TaxID=67265 RepID=A0ABW1EYF3_9ACTN|nr:class I SAM-dependent methyltransferase [Kitasatospora sp. CM 4170]WNM49524.1 class I SAM-dependent methyltransferase [Kitasatospora sp. CM 4170]
MNDASVARFYDQLAADYHLIYGDWDGAVVRQSRALDALIRSALGPEPAEVLDCACGIGTQAVGLAALGHRVTGTDLSPVAAERAGREAAQRGLDMPTRTADMRSLPFEDAAFDVVVCADNALPHLLTAADLRAALGEMRRVLRSGGLLLVSTRPYDEIRRSRPASTAPQLHGSGRDRTVTFQLWDWHDDGERYDLEHFQLVPEGDDWRVAVRRTTYWALTKEQLIGAATEAGFDAPAWMPPEDTAFFQPLLVARVP